MFIEDFAQKSFGGRVHNHLEGNSDYPIHAELLNSQAVTQTQSQFGTSLLPQGYIEGSPMHPSYGAGHATVAGACITILKAFFDESLPFSNLADPVVPNTDGTALTPYTGDDAGSMTVGGELNKLAANMSIGRNFAGIHYRSDYWSSLTLGESAAIRFLRQQRRAFVERGSFRLTRFNGKEIRILSGSQEDLH